MTERNHPSKETLVQKRQKLLRDLENLKAEIRNIERQIRALEVIGTIPADISATGRKKKSKKYYLSLIETAFKQSVRDKLSAKQMFERIKPFDNSIRYNTFRRYIGIAEEEGTLKKIKGTYLWIFIGQFSDKK